MFHRIGAAAYRDNLDNTYSLCSLTGNPEKTFRSIHIAGTNGKGSVSYLIASVLQSAGFKGGLYTSPHLHKVNERICILNAQNRRAKDPFSGAIADEDFAAVVASLRPSVAAIQNKGEILTFFEVLTVAALCYFAKAKVDIVILETGLGGRLDATNAVDSLVAVITPVSLDHTAILGPDIEKIASEKAGIIKNSHQKVVIAPQEKDAMDVILKRCREFGVAPVIVSPEKYENEKISLKGRHQIMNAATAMEVVSILQTRGLKISDEAKRDGLKNVVWPGRFDLLSKDPDVIVDCAHNEASAKALADTLKQEYRDRRVILVLGTSEDKDAAGIFNSLKDNAAHIILTRAAHPRARTFTKEEGKLYLIDKPFEITDSVHKALDKALRLAEPKDVIVVTGSIFVVAEAMDCMK